jgi:hypothetical protein
MVVGSRSGDHRQSIKMIGELLLIVLVFFRTGFLHDVVKGFIEKTLDQRRSLETALADLLAEYQRKPRPELARTIELLRAEIEFRKRPVEPS